MFALVDCNAFYVSCERVFRPDLRQRATVVLSNNDGCIIARSPEARALGVEMGVPLHLVPPELKAQLVIFSSNYRLYGDMSRRVMDVLQHFSPRLEVYSIDEAFLTVDTVPDQTYEDVATAIRNTVLRHTGLPVGVGIGRTKTLAKAANRFAKTADTGVCVLRREDEAEYLASMPVDKIWGIGRQLSGFLGSLGIDTALALRQMDFHSLRIGKGQGVLPVYYELNGQPMLKMDEGYTPRKNICTSRSFSHPVTSQEDLNEAVSFYASVCAEKMRRHQGKTGAVYVSLSEFHQTGRKMYRTDSTVISLPGLSGATADIVACALRGVRQLYRRGCRYKKAGVVLLDITYVKDEQMTLLPGTVASDSALDQAMDRINAKYAKRVIFLGSEGTRKTWAMKRQFVSPAYTTKWQDIIEIRCD